jgi:hypothetical protein
MAGGIVEAVVTREMIERRAFELSLVERSRSPEENWQVAEQQLREELRSGWASQASSRRNQSRRSPEALRPRNGSSTRQ